MTFATFSTSLEAQQAADLLEGYHFELGNHDAPQWVSLWLEFYKPLWIRDAVIEALYQGRYKSVSVRQILELWQRRGKPIRHVTHEFETAVCREFGGAKLVAPAPPAAKLQLPNKAASRQRASHRIHQSLSSISFNLSEQPTTPPGQNPLNQNPLNQNHPLNQSASTQRFKAHSQTQLAPARASDAISDVASGIERLTAQPLPTQADQPDIKSTASSSHSQRYTNPTETAETLRTHRQLNGILFPSARAIQPFKPALPFSAQTLRLAKQKALALSETMA
ncbi:MAG: hypothetical protein AAFR58_08755 [Cyanobacteria bacterium J06627_28]